MMRTILVIGCVFCMGIAGAQSEWPTFHGNNARDGRSNVDFPGSAFKRAWTFSLDEHTFAYAKGTSVWSSCAVFGTVDGKTMVYVGAYDRNLYAIDAKTGDEVWRYTTGGTLNAAPTFALVGNRAIVFIGSSDRTLYAIDAGTGEKVWSREVLPWSYTVSDSIPSATLVADVNGRDVVTIGFYLNDRKSVRTIEYGALFAFDAATGDQLWVTDHVPGTVSTQSIVHADDRWLIFFGCEDGRMRAVDARTGEFAWEVTLGHSITATPTVAKLRGRLVVIAGDFFGMLWCLDAGTGKMLWYYKTGHQVISTTAVDDVPTIYVGSHDRYVHAIDPTTRKPRWKFVTGKYITSSPVLATIARRSAVIFNGLDDYLYVVDAESGEELWKFETGSMLWAYETRGTSLWSSPSAATVDGMAMLVLPSHDGKLYAFTASRGSSASTGSKEAVAPSVNPIMLYATPVIGSLLILAGISIVARERVRAPRV